MKVTSTAIPKNSLIRKHLPANYSDTFECSVVDDVGLTPDDIHVAFWTIKPKWYTILYRIRTILVKPFGLKTETPDNKTLEYNIRNNVSSDTFSVIDKTENETIIRLTDKHLEARLSVHLDKKENNLTTISIITVVHFHNALGYVYFYSILPFHYLVVKYMFTNTIKKLVYKE